MIKTFIKNNLIYCIPLYFMSLSVIGVFNFTSPVPVEDYWDQIINFLNMLVVNEKINWFSQHNEHRIFVARFFYYLYYNYFPDFSYSLIILNYFLYFLVAIFFIKLKSRLYENLNETVSKLTNILIISFVFFWSQKLNFTFEVQNQAILAQFIPLLTFYFTYQFIKYKKISFLILMIISLILAPFTMISGIFVGPILIFIILIFFSNEKKLIFLLFLISLGLSFFYFYDYSSPNNQASIYSNLIKYNYKCIIFFLNFLGSFFHFLLGKSLFSSYLSSFFGIAFLYIFLRKFKDDLFSKKSENFIYYGFIFYLLIIAALTSFGRINYGMEKAFSGRYSTPVICGLLSLWMIYLPEITNFYLKQKKLFYFFITTLFILMSIYQLTALRNNDEKFSLRQLGLLSLTLQANDDTVEKKLHQDLDNIRKIAFLAKKNNIDIFRNKLYGQILNSNSGSRDLILEINDYSLQSVNDNWFYIEISKKLDFDLIYFLDADYNNIGRAIKLKNDNIAGYVEKIPTYIRLL